MSDIYFTADTHYGHKNLVKGVSRWDDKRGCRPFESIESHNEAIVEGINNTVGEEDVLYHLGDWNFGGPQNIWNLRKKLNVKEIHFIFGNHDQVIEKNSNIIIPDKEKTPFYDLEYKKLKWRKVIKPQTLFASTQYYKEIKVHGHRICLFHYAMDVWNKRHHGAFHLFGHSHNTLPDRGDRRLDVGLESAYERFGEWRPFSFKEIQSILQPREYKPLDHHNKNTTE